MKKHTLHSLLVVVMLAITLTAGTLATLSDTEASGGNEIAGGTLDLTLRDNDEGWRDGVLATWSASNMKPGQEYRFDDDSHSLLVRNEGSLPATSLDFKVINTVSDPSGPESDTQENTSDLDVYMEITKMDYWGSAAQPPNGAVNLLNYLSDANGNGWKDLDDLEQSPIMGQPAPLSMGELVLRLRFHPDADNRYQGAALSSDFVITMHQ